MGAGPDQPCARPEATVAARPLKKTDIVLTRPIWSISSHLWVDRGSDVGGQGSSEWAGAILWQGRGSNTQKSLFQPNSHLKFSITDRQTDLLWDTLS